MKRVRWARRGALRARLGRSNVPRSARMLGVDVEFRPARNAGRNSDRAKRSLESGRRRQFAAQDRVRLIDEVSIRPGRIGAQAGHDLARRALQRVEAGGPIVTGCVVCGVVGARMRERARFAGVVGAEEDTGVAQRTLDVRDGTGVRILCNAGYEFAVRAFALIKRGIPVATRSRSAAATPPNGSLRRPINPIPAPRPATSRGPMSGARPSP